MKQASKWLCGSLILGTVAVANPALATSADTRELVIYSARNDHLVKPLFDLYSEETGTQIRFITDKEAPLLARLQAEGENTPADLLITVDAGNLWQAKQMGVLQPYDGSTINANIPAHLRDPDNYWTGLSVRARTIVYNSEAVNPDQLSTYEALANEDWKGKLCLRTAKKVYNQSLVATLIERKGVEETEALVKGWVDNLAAPVFSNDTQAMEAVAAGQCDATVVNTYYYGRLQKDNPSTPLKLFFANQETSGTHVNVSGAGITKHAKHPAEAQKFLTWLTTGEAQKIFAEVNMEYPAAVNAEWAEQVKGWGTFKQDELNVEAAGRLQAEAIKLMDRAGYN